MENRKKIIEILVWLLLIIALLFYFYYCVKKSDRECVGYNLGSYDIEPIVVQGELYFPIPQSEYPYTEDWDRESCMELLGNIKSKYTYEIMGKIRNPLEYIGYFILNEVRVDKRYENNEYLQVDGSYVNDYLKAVSLENETRTQQLLDNYSSYILIKHKKTSGDKYIFPEELIVELEREYGECSYDVNDFDEMAGAYYIFVNPYFQNEGEIFSERQYIATIFFDEQGNFYYCNHDNLINDEMSQKIKKILEEGEVIEEEQWELLNR